MDAKYYRFLYHPVSQGLCFSASVGAAKGNDGTQILVLGGDAKNNGNEDIPVSAMTEHLHILILADLLPLTLGRAQKIYQTAKVETILLPGDKPLPFAVQESTGIIQVKETCELNISDFILKVYNTGEKPEEKLIVYIGSRGICPDTHECVMNVKPCTQALPCSLAVDTGNLNCEMRCLLCADITQCKKHNQRSESSFIDGHLLPGMADLSACLPELRQFLADEWKTIRFVKIPMGDSQEAQIEDLMDVGKSGYRRYFIGTAAAAPETMKAVATRDAFSSFAFTGEDAGLCVSGCYVKR